MQHWTTAASQVLWNSATSALNGPRDCSKLARKGLFGCSKPAPKRLAGCSKPATKGFCTFACFQDCSHVTCSTTVLIFQRATSRSLQQLKMTAIFIVKKRKNRERRKRRDEMVLGDQSFREKVQLLLAVVVHLLFCEWIHELPLKC